MTKTSKALVPVGFGPSCCSQAAGRTSAEQSRGTGSQASETGPASFPRPQCQRGRAGQRQLSGECHMRGAPSWSSSRPGHDHRQRARSLLPAQHRAQRGPGHVATFTITLREAQIDGYCSNRPVAVRRAGPPGKRPSTRGRPPSPRRSPRQWLPRSRWCTQAPRRPCPVGKGFSATHPTASAVVAAWDYVAETD